ncbi:MAG TPA: potassium channel protein [Pyrinomonadaceae bacterium]|jgi:voltage-gated potassium channel|nr:potassium channel protein [Pyrinomonadaceae bacterium]
MRSRSSDPFNFRPSRTRAKIGVIAVLVAMTIGTLVFHVIERWTILDSLYVTAQTVTTVGFGDLAPRTHAGRAFATVFMMVGVGIVLYALTSTVQSIVQSELLATFGQRRYSRKMSRLRNHFIICGAGRVGSHLVRALMGSEHPFIVIESDAKKVAQLMDLGIAVLVRDATLEESLREAGVEHARGLAACLPDDANNVYVVLTARDLNPKLHIVARAAEEQAEHKLIRAGANRVVAPTLIGGHRMAMALTKPAVEDFLGSITANELDLGFEQLEVGPVSKLIGRKLRETNIRSELNIVVVSIKRIDGQIIFNPSGETLIENGDLLIAIGSAETLAKLKALARGEPTPSGFARA